MEKILLIGIGGACGAISRYALAGWTQRLTDTSFPWGTWVVNVLGCFAIGWLGTLAEERMWLSPAWRLLLLIGFLGAFTTFSTFTFETWGLLKGGEGLRASLNIFSSFVGCFAGLFAGILLARTLS